MNSMKIGIISDTHNLLRDEVLEELKDCDHIIHAGDVSTEDTYKEIKNLGNVTIVKGNNDKDEWANVLKDFEIMELNGYRIYVVHDIKNVPKNLKDIDIVVFGHSHKYFDEVLEGIRFFNPGSCGKKRFSLPLTFAIGTLVNNTFNIRRIDL